MDYIDNTALDKSFSMACKLNAYACILYREIEEEIREMDHEHCCDEEECEHGCIGCTDLIDDIDDCIVVREHTTIIMNILADMKRRRMEL